MEIPPEWGGAGSGKRVVVIGGGVAGSLIANSLQFDADLTLIDPKEYFEIPWASLRAKVEPSFAERSVIHHKDYLTNGRLLVSHVTSITTKEVLAADGCQVAYDYLVIATGHYDPLPLTRTQRLADYKRENEKIKAAESILIVGGGPTGVELAAEIAVDFRGKKVTLVHKGSRLLEFIGPKASDKTLKWLKSKKVEVKLMQSVDLGNNNNSDGYITSSGDIIKADCHFICTGNPPGSAWLRNTFLKDRIDSYGRLNVDENLQVKGHGNIFAIGDITDIRELKQGYSAQKHALVAAKNLKLLMSGAKERKLATYEPHSSNKIIVSLGRQDAVAQFPFTTMIGLVPGMIKSKDLFVGKTRKKMGLHPNIVLS